MKDRNIRKIRKNIPLNLISSLSSYPSFLSPIPTFLLCAATSTPSSANFSKLAHTKTYYTYEIAAAASTIAVVMNYQPVGFYLTIRFLIYRYPPVKG